MTPRRWRFWHRGVRPEAAGRPSPKPAPVPLGAEDERELERVVAVLAASGVFAPEVPGPAWLAPAVADAGPPVTASVVLAAAGEADWWFPDRPVPGYAANLAFHASHVEQDVDGLTEQAADILRLSGGVPVDVQVDVTDGDVSLRIAGERVPTYPGAAKYLSTVLHVELARRLRGRGRRLAWLWDDQGCHLTCLPDGEVGRLNAALGDAAGEGWEWVDEQEPVIAGISG